MWTGDNLKISFGVCVFGSIHWSARYYVLAWGCLLEDWTSSGLPTDQQQDFKGTNSPLTTFASKEYLWQAWTHLRKLATETSVLASRNQHESTVWENAMTASTALPRALNSHPCLKKKKIAISLIAAKWHTKRKLTIGCYLYSQSDSHFPASLSPFGCQADYSLPISFRPRQPKKAPSHRATTSSLFWY